HQPSARRTAVEMRQAGLRACERNPWGFPNTAPSHAGAQWPTAVSRLAYRCGGSAGIATVRAWRTGFPVSPPRTGAPEAGAQGSDPGRQRQCAQPFIACWSSQNLYIFKYSYRFMGRYRLLRAPKMITLSALRHIAHSCALSLLLLAGAAQASWQDALPEARLIGGGDLRLFGFRIYTARLWSPTEPFRADAPFALELTYHRSIERDDLVEASLKEIRRLNGDAIDAAQLQRWQAQMRRAFVDVQPGERIIGVHLPDQGAR